MSKATVTLSVMVTLDVPENLAGKVTRDDLIDMARSACPSSMQIPGPPRGIQVSVESMCQEEENGAPVFADVFVEHDICTEPEIEFEDDGFTKAESEDPLQMGG